MPAFRLLLPPVLAAALVAGGCGDSTTAADPLLLMQATAHADAEGHQAGTVLMQAASREQMLVYFGMRAPGEAQAAP